MAVSAWSLTSEGGRKLFGVQSTNVLEHVSGRCMTRASTARQTCGARPADTCLTGKNSTVLTGPSTVSGAAPDDE
jgi:hypothetical protein